MDIGFYTSDQLSNEAYHSGPGVSNSGLKLIGEKTPAHFWARYIDPNRRKSTSTQAMMIGTAIHAAALEPDLFEQQYVVAPSDDRRLKAYKEWAEFQTKIILTPTEHENVIGMRRALHENRLAGALLRGAELFEYSAYANDPETGLLVRMRMDLMTENGFIVDLKKCQDASPAGVAKAVANFGYYHQDAFYTDVMTWACGEPPRGFAFIFVEEQPPHAVGVYILSDSDRERGRLQYRKNLRLYAKCIESGKWPAYSEEAQVIELPSWARRTIDTNLENTL